MPPGRKSVRRVEPDARFDHESRGPHGEGHRRLGTRKPRGINHRLKDGGITFHLSEVKGLVMDRLKRSYFLEELTGKAHLSQYDAVHSINPDLARSALEVRRTEQPVETGVVG
jgi:hypothetical protein